MSVDIPCPRGPSAVAMCKGKLVPLKRPDRYVCTYCARRFAPAEVAAIQKARTRFEMREQQATEAEA